MQIITSPATKQSQPKETKVANLTNQTIKLKSDVLIAIRFPWNPPPTISQRMENYRKLRFIRPGARSPLPEDLVEQKRVSIK